MIVQITLDANDPQDVSFLLRAVQGIVPVAAPAVEEAAETEEPKAKAKAKAKPKAKAKAKPKAEEPAPEAEAPTEEFTEEEVRSRFSSFVTENGTDVAMGILKDFEVGRMSELTESRYGEFMAALDKVNG